MNALSTLWLQATTVLAQAAPAAKKPDAEPTTPLIGPDGYFGYLQVVLFFVMLGLIGFYFYYRKKQQQNQ